MSEMKCELNPVKSITHLPCFVEMTEASVEATSSRTTCIGASTMFLIPRFMSVNGYLADYLGIVYR